MKSIVVYASRFGNTRKLAEAIADELQASGNVRLVAADEASPILLKETDLLVIGCPTEGHRMMEPVSRFFERIGPTALHGMAAVAFDTRLGWPLWLSGSAAAGTTKRLRAASARQVLPSESFLVAGGRTREETTLEAGELERARAWARSLPAVVEAERTAAAVN
jgi:flavodoxin